MANMTNHTKCTVFINSVRRDQADAAERFLKASQQGKLTNPNTGTPIHLTNLNEATTYTKNLFTTELNAIKESKAYKHTPIYDQRRLEAEAATNVLNEAKLTLLF